MPCEVTSVPLVKRTVVSAPSTARTLNSSPFRVLTTPWIFCLVPCGTWTGRELSEFWADAPAAARKTKQATATNPIKGLRFLISMCSFFRLRFKRTTFVVLLILSQSGARGVLFKGEELCSSPDHKSCSRSLRHPTCSRQFLRPVGQFDSRVKGFHGDTVTF